MFSIYIFYHIVEWMSLVYGNEKWGKEKQKFEFFGDKILLVCKLLLRKTWKNHVLKYKILFLQYNCHLHKNKN